MQFQKSTTTPSNNDPQKGKFAILQDPIQLILLILDKWKWILFSTIATTTIALIYLYIATPIYQAKARIEIFQEDRLVAKRLTVFGRMERSAQRHILLLGSQNVRREVVKKLRPEWEQQVENLSIPISLKIVRESRGTMLDISASAPNAEYAKVYLKELIEEYRELRSNELNEINQYALAGLRSEEQQVLKELETAKIMLHTFVEENEVFLSQELEDMDAVFINQLLSRLKTIRLERTMLEIQYEDIIHADLATIREALELSRGIRPPSTPSLDTSDSRSSGPSTPQATGLILPGMAVAADTGSSDSLIDWEQQEEQLAILKNRYKEQLLVFKSTHPEMQRLNSQIESLENNLKKKAEIALRRFQARFTALKMQEKSIESVVETWEHDQPLSIERKNEYLVLQTRVDHLQRKYDAVYKRLLDTSGTNDSLSIRIIQPPASFMNPVSPKSSKVMLAGLASGLFLSIGAILLLEVFKPESLDIEYIESHHDVPCLITIPDWSKILDVTEFNPEKDRLVVHKDKNQVASETYRALRYRLSTIFKEDKPFSIALTSANRNDGKSFNSINFAVPYAWDGKRVLLIDGDIRRANLTNTLLGQRVSKGWTTWLHDNSANLQRLITKVGNTGVDILPAGIFDDSIPDLLKMDLTTKVIDQLHNDYDVIIIDTAPTTMVVETNEICKATDGVILMADENTKKMEITSALRYLKETNVIGFCVNKVQPKENTNYSYYGYSAGYPEENAILNKA